MTLCDAMMELKHPTNKKFTLLLNQQTLLQKMACSNNAQICQITSTCYDCGIVTIPSEAACSKSTRAQTICTQKWFKPAARRKAEDAFWCPRMNVLKTK